jgi:serine/threonine protein kinase
MCTLLSPNLRTDVTRYAQIGDLGSSRFSDAGLTLTAQVGTPLYMAPEMNDDACGYTWAVDVYSFALIVYAVLVGQPAFPLTLAPTALMKKIVMDDRPPLPVDMDATVKTIVERGWSVDATMRPSFDEIFSVLELIEFKLNPGVDPARVHDFMSLVGCGSGASVANVLGERRPGNAPADTVVDAASRELSMFLLVDWELAVDRRESPCVL